MAVNISDVELERLGIVAGKEESFAIPTYDTSWIYVYYGNQRTQASPGLDYDIALHEENDFQNFTIVPKGSLIDKIDAAIVLDPTEVNKIAVRRHLPYTNDFTESDAFQRAKIEKEFDRLIMRVQEAAYQFRLSAYAEIQGGPISFHNGRGIELASGVAGSDAATLDQVTAVVAAAILVAGGFPRAVQKDPILDPAYVITSGDGGSRLIWDNAAQATWTLSKTAVAGTELSIVALGAGMVKLVPQAPATMESPFDVLPDGLHNGTALPKGWIYATVVSNVGGSAARWLLGGLTAIIP
jgi:hypothetical protein